MTSPIRDLLNFALLVHEEQLQLAGGADNGEPCPYRRTWRETVSERGVELKRLHDAALQAAGRLTTYPIVDAQRKLKTLYDRVMALLHWPRNAGRLRESEAKKRRAGAGYSSGPVSDYLSHHCGKLVEPWRDVEALAVLAEAKTDVPPVAGKARKKSRMTWRQADTEMGKCVEAIPERMGLSSHEWSKLVGCSAATIIKTPTYKRGEKARRQNHQDRRQSNRGKQRPRHYGSD